MTTYITQEQILAIGKSVLNKVDAYDDGIGFAREIEAAAIQAYRDSLVAGVVLPEPVAHVSSLQSGSPLMLGLDEWHRQGLVGLHTADQVRQAVADALAKQQDHLQDIAAFIGVGGYNGATTEQLIERIKGEFQRLGRLLNDALAKQVPPEKCSLCGAPIGEECFLQNSSQSNCKMAKQVPQGYKLVPIKANAAMLKAATNTWKRSDSIPVGASYWSFSYGQAKEVWDNMIAAAPDPKEAV